MHQSERRPIPAQGDNSSGTFMLGRSPDYSHKPWRTIISVFVSCPHVLHPVDIAPSKVMTAAGRQMPADAIDLLTILSHILPLGTVHPGSDRESARVHTGRADRRNPPQLSALQGRRFAGRSIKRTGQPQDFFVSRHRRHSLALKGGWAHLQVPFDISEKALWHIPRAMKAQRESLSISVPEAKILRN